MSSRLIKDFAGLAARHTPFLRDWYYRQRFLRDPGVSGLRFWGVYASFDEARKHIPPGRNGDHEHANWARRFQEDLGNVQLYDYPVLFWLAQILPEGPRLFDLGGNTGLTYYACQQLVRCPESLDWTVCDLPEVVEVGRELAAKQGNDHLHFTTDRGQAETCDTFLCCGTFQYLEEPLSAMLAELKHKPRHVIINRVPLYEGETFVTLQNLGAICPYRISNRREFIDSLESQGYRLVDSWNMDRPCEIPMRPDKVVRAYYGMYLRAEEKSGATLPGSRRERLLEN